MPGRIQDGISAKGAWSPITVLTGPDVADFVDVTYANAVIFHIDYAKSVID